MVCAPPDDAEAKALATEEKALVQRRKDQLVAARAELKAKSIELLAMANLDFLNHLRKERPELKGVMKLIHCDPFYKHNLFPPPGDLTLYRSHFDYFAADGCFLVFWGPDHKLHHVVEAFESVGNPSGAPEDRTKWCVASKWHGIAREPKRTFHRIRPGNSHVGIAESYVLAYKMVTKKVRKSATFVAPSGKGWNFNIEELEMNFDEPKSGWWACHYLNYRPPTRAERLWSARTHARTAQTHTLAGIPPALSRERHGGPRAKNPST